MMLRLGELGAATMRMFRDKGQKKKPPKKTPQKHHHKDMVFALAMLCLLLALLDLSPCPPSH